MEYAIVSVLINDWCDQTNPEWKILQLKLHFPIFLDIAAFKNEAKSYLNTLVVSVEILVHQY